MILSFYGSSGIGGIKGGDGMVHEKDGYPMNFIEWLIFNWYNVNIEIDKLELVETMWEQFSNLGIYESNVIDTTMHSISDTVSAVREMVASGLVLLF